MPQLLAYGNYDAPVDKVEPLSIDYRGGVTLLFEAQAVLEYIQLRMWHFHAVGHENGNVEFKTYTTTAGHLPNALLDTITIPFSSLTTGAPAYGIDAPEVDFTLSSPITIPDGEERSFGWYYDDTDFSNRIGWHSYTSGEHVPDGTGIASSDAGVNWGTITGHIFVRAYGYWLPVKAVITSPTDGSTTVSGGADLLLNWEGQAKATSYDVYFGKTGSLAFYANTTTSQIVIPYALMFYDTGYEWRIDVLNEDADTPVTITGDTWTFTTIDLSFAANKKPLKRLCACANNKFWYEDI